MSLAGTIMLELGLDSSNLRKQILSSTKDVTNQMNKTSNTVSNQLTSSFSGMGKMIAGALSVGAITMFGKSCLDLGSDLSEVQNVVDTAFKSMNSHVNSFAKGAMENFGLSETIAKKYMGTIGAMNNAFGFTEKASYDMAEAVTGLTGDVASFYNLSSDEAFTKLKSIWTGETESLKELGVVMTQTALDQYALNNGFGKTTANMTEQEKVMLRFQYVTSALSDASGDFIKTQDSWANQTRVLQLQMESFKATIGQGLINLLTPILQMLNQLAKQAVTAADAFKSFTEAVTGVSSSGGGETAKAMQEITKSAEEATESVEATTGSLASFDKMDKIGNSSSGQSGVTSDAGTPQIDTAVSEQTKKSNKILMDFFKPIQQSWSKYGKPVLSSWRKALSEIKKAAVSVGKSFANVWKNGSGVTLCSNILKLFGQMGNVLADISTAFKNAWNDNGAGENLIQSYFDKWNSILELLYTVGESARDVWNNGTGESILSNIFGIITNINTGYSNLATNVTNAWNANGTGTAILQNLADMVNDILSSANQVSGYWSEFAKTVDLKPLFTEFEGLTGSFEELVETAGNTVVWANENIIGPLAKWAIEDAVPASISALSGALDVLNSVLDALKPMGEWMFDNLLEPLAKWTGGKIVDVLEGISDALKGVSDWIDDNQPVVQAMTGIVVAFGAAWQGLSFAEFIVSAGGITGMLTKMTGALKACTFAKLADKWETIQLLGLYAKDFFMGLANNIKQLALSAAGWASNTAAMIANKVSLIAQTVATGAHTAATTAATIATTAFNTALTILTSPITLVIVAIAALVAGVILLIKNWDKVKEVALKVWKKITSAVSGAVKKIKDAFKGIGNWFKTLFEGAWSNVKTAWSGTKTFFSGIWTGIKSAFSNVSNWFKDTFKTAWQGVKDVFSTGGKIFDGIKDGIAGVFKTVVNGLIEGINKVISVPFKAINKMLNKIRNVGVGGVKPFKGLWDKNPLSVPEIPKLAQGGYVKPNTPQLAMIGDNRHQGEVVAPEDKLQALLEQAKGSDSQLLEMILHYLILLYNKDTTAYVELQGDAGKLFKMIQKEAQKYKKRTGRAPFPT